MSHARDRQRMIGQSRSREPFHTSCTDFPSTFLDLAHAIEIGGRAHGCPALAGGKSIVEIGHSGDDYEPARRMMVANVRRGEFTDRSGVSVVPTCEDRIDILDALARGRH